MDALATLVGCFTAVVPIVVLSGAVATLDYRVSGIRKDEALERAVLGLVLSVGWGLGLASLIAATHWTRSTPSPLFPSASIAALTVLPVAFGILPSAVLVILALGPSSGTPDRRPTWRDWMDAY